MAAKKRSSRGGLLNDASSIALTGSQPIYIRLHDGAGGDPGSAQGIGRAFILIAKTAP